MNSPRTTLFFWTLLLVLLAATAGAAEAPPSPPPEWVSAVLRDHPLVGRIWDVAAGGFIEPAALVDRLSQRRFVLLGERHDHPDHHRLQAWTLRALIAAGRRPAVAFEMFSADTALAIAAHVARAPLDAAGLGPAVEWKRSGWPDWSMYRPIAQAALDAHVPILAANLSRADTKTLNERGVAGLDRAVATRLGLDQPPSAAARAAMADEIRRAHCGHAPETILDRMIDVQRARDAAMADTMASAGADGTVLIAGNGHIRTDRGVPAHLRRVAPGATIGALAFLEVERGEMAPAHYAEEGGQPIYDFVWFTPRVDDVDPCEKFKGSLEKIK